MPNEKLLINEVKGATEVDQVFAAVSQLEFSQPSNRLTSLVAKKLKDLKGRIDVSIGLLSNFTIDMLVPHIAASLASIGFTSDCYVAPFNQYYQEVLNPDSKLLILNPDIVVLTISMRELSPDIFYRFAELDNKQREEQLNSVLEHVLGWLNVARKNLNSIILISNFIPVSQPKLGVADFRETETEAEFYQNLNKKIRLSLLDFKQVYLLDLASLSQQVGWKHIYDPKMYFLAKLLWSDEFSYHISKEIAAYTFAIKGQTKKCLVLDLDNTLWGGILGEDGIQGIKAGSGDPISEAYYEFQQKIRSLKQRGIILALCSKNNFDDVAETFSSREDFPLKMSDFSAVRINWDMKHQNLLEIAQELNIGLDSLVFIDDNPVEVTLVNKMLPEVTALLLPESHEKIPGFIDSLPYFEKLFVIDTDRNKTQQYQQNKERSNLQSQATSINEYLNSLGTKVKLRRVKKEDFERVHQLFTKTNQFNLTTIRYQLPDVEKFADDMSYDFFCFSVEDKFGDLGIVGLILIQKYDDTAEIDSFIMSCRAMGRGIETSAVNWLKDYYLNNKYLSRLVASYIPTRKNIPVKDFFVKQGFEQKGNEEEKIYYQLELNDSTPIECEWIELISEV